MKLTKNQLREIHIGIVHYLLSVGITDNKDITQVIKPLISHDKLRGVKRSITVSKDVKLKPKAAVVPNQKKGKLNEAKGKVTVKAKVKNLQTHVTARNVDVEAIEAFDDLEKARIHAYKEEIKRFCNHGARSVIRQHNMTPEEIEAGGREVYREPYRTLYHQFDLRMNRMLAQQGKTIEQYGLGFRLNKNTQNYLDRVAKAGFIKALYQVARELYANK